jgi:hypothetical protein
MWTGDTAILSNQLLSTTSALIPAMNVSITARYTCSGSTGDQIRYFPREGYNSRMVGGIFEGTNGDPITGPYTVIHAITTNPPLAWSSG